MQEGARQEVLGTSIQALSALFYANDRLVALPERSRLRGAFGALTGLFDQVGFQTNKGKIVIISFRPYHTPHAWSTEAYTWRVTGRGISYRNRLQQRVHFLEFGVNLVDGLLVSHRQRQHGVGQGEANPQTPPRN